MNPPSDFATFLELYNTYSRIFSVDVQEYEEGRVPLVLPHVSEPTIRSLCSSVTEQFEKDPMILKIDRDVIIVGDLHGHILDLFRILKRFGSPPIQNYLFLGDIVDRGEFSTETITLVFLLKVIWPQNVYIIRGNHEFAEMCKIGGFCQELATIYADPSIELPFLKAFEYIPLAALIYNRLLCLHGGIGPNVPDLNTISRIQRPLVSYQIEPVDSIVWSDPTSYDPEYTQSARGSGYLFGEVALNRFLIQNDIDILIRAHECVDNGASTTFGRKLITVFSASNYCGAAPNKAGVVLISCMGQKKDVYIFSPIKYLERSMANFELSNKKTPRHRERSKTIKILPSLNAPSSANESDCKNIRLQHKTKSNIMFQTTPDFTSKIPCTPKIYFNNEIKSKDTKIGTIRKQNHKINEFQTIRL